MYLTKTIPIKEYSTKLQFIITSDIVKVHNRINEYHRTGVVWKKGEGVEGCMILCSMSKYYMLINSNYLTVDTIAHELYHCVCNIAGDRGIFEEESRAWLQGFIAQQIYNFLKDKKIEL